MLKFGCLTLSSPCMLAPLAGISDLPFRLVNRLFGCELAFVEMISARSLVQRNRRTLRMLSTAPQDRPLGIQLLGNDAGVIREALNIIRTSGFDIIDFNAACPVSKVTERGEGASLLREPRRLRELLRTLVEHSEAPVTVKIRTGWDAGPSNAREVALYARDAGIAGLFIHGRTRVQGYGGRVDYDAIREVKDALDIPVLASGDALSPALIKKMFDETGCDGVVIARGAFGNPWIFREVGEFLKGGDLPPRPGLDEILDTMLDHYHLCCDFYGERIGTMLFRKFFAWYTTGIPDMKQLRSKAFLAKTKEQMTGIIRKALNPKTADEKYGCGVNER